MTTARIEAFLAEIYVDAAARMRFLADRAGAARAAGLTNAECEALERIDVDGLKLAAQSFARKRTMKAARKKSRFARWFRR